MSICFNKDNNTWKYRKSILKFINVLIINKNPENPIQKC